MHNINRKMEQFMWDFLNEPKNISIKTNEQIRLCQKKKCLSKISLF